MQYGLLCRVVCAFVVAVGTIGASGDRHVTDLSGTWHVVADPNDRGQDERWSQPGQLPEGQPIAVPGAWETALGTDYDSVAWYWRDVTIPAVQAGDSVLLRFEAAATGATVWIDGTEAGRHAGPWTPFAFDVTRLVTPGRPARIVVRLEEMVGHSTQGFLPIIAPHFAGLWQDVKLIVTARAWLDETRLVIDASEIDMAAHSGALRAAVPVMGQVRPGDTIRFSLFDPEGRQVGLATKPYESENAMWRWQGPVELWDLSRPRLYQLRAELLNGRGDVLDAVQTSVGFRQVTTQGPRILLNGKDLIVRGVLTWGYNPPSLAPALDPDRFRTQLQYFRSCGFNLIKFCLWLPPRALLDIVDQEGMLAWVEYPTWHPKIDRDHRDKLLAEYTEMSHHDGNHPCVILRSITCETGPSADLSVIRDLYDLLKRRCPGTLVLDDSSWIGWNRIHDFWDDHSYGNNRTWRDTLASLQNHIDAHGVKPLLLGEAIAADTWVDIPALEAAGGADGWWGPRWLEAQRQFERELRQRFGRPGYDPVVDLRTRALKYALDMRRWQLETYRQQMPHSGYVVSVIQDVTLCAMGLLDYSGRPKWSTDTWRFHGPLMTPVNPVGDQRGFRAGAELTFEFCLRVTPEADLSGPVDIQWSLGEHQAGTQHEAAPIELKLPTSVERPERLHVKRAMGREDEISWELWALPEPAPAPEGLLICGDADGLLQRLFPQAAVLEPDQEVTQDTDVVVTRVMSRAILDYLRAGGRVLHLTSNQSGSFKDAGTWFLRGTAWTPREPQAFFECCPGAMLSYLQLFELGGNSVIRGEVLWEQVDPLLAFIETHDLTVVRPNLLLFQTGVGEGRLIVSCLRHQGGRATNYSGLWLARQLVAHLRTGPAPTRALDTETTALLYDNLDTETVDLDSVWRFTTDPNDLGVAAGFYETGFDDSLWQTLETRSEAEGAIWSRYDGWGWYRQTVAVPAAWRGKRVRLVFDNVDDMYRLYVNGVLAGGYGRIDRSESSFLKRTWVDVSAQVQCGADNLLVVRVHDWVGAGGLSGKVWLTTGPVEARLELLRR